METSAIVMMAVALTTVWGGLGASILHIVRVGKRNKAAGVPVDDE